MRALVLCFWLIGCGGNDVAQPNGYAQCAAMANTPLYCDTLVGKQALQGVAGQCCSVGAGASSMVGYLCPYVGGNGQPTTTSGGVCNGMDMITAGCPDNGVVVRCCGGGPC